jgi:hypothetical protein
VQLALINLADFAPQHADGDVFIFSKCHDSRALVAAAALANSGRLVGVDLFDDYFSNPGDSRLARFHNWLAQILDSCTFALCSTQRLAALVGDYRCDIPVHLMNDPACDDGTGLLPQFLSAKRHRTLDSRQLKVAWFGVGDNPNFAVGLHDLCAFAGVLRELRRTGLSVELSVLTNARALTAHGLEQLRRLPVPTQVSEWTEERERDLLAEAFIAFLPVNVQPFSTAKSLNRAVTALSAGCQVLSVGYPLYRQLDPLIYRDPQELLADLADNSLRLSAARIGRYRAIIETFASPHREASRLTEFLARLSSDERAEKPLVLVHGHATSGSAHKLVKELGGLSVASPYSTAALGYDVIFRRNAGGLDMFVSERASRRLQPEARARAGATLPVSGKSFLEIRHDEPVIPTGTAYAGGWQDAPLPFQMATYADTMRKVRARIGAAFGYPRILVSEMSPLPFPAVD